MSKILRAKVSVRADPSVTDWDAYYSQPASTASLTRAMTRSKILKFLAEHLRKAPLREIVELGGGNSCVFQALASAFKPRTYTVVDKNERGLVEFCKTHAETHRKFGIRVSLQCSDLTLPFTVKATADLCLSLGLIEHFSLEGTALLVKRHFEFVRPGGLVLMTYPTPTFLYRIIRGAAESMRVWKFPDERALRKQEVVHTAQGLGATLLKHQTHWKIGLTQDIILFRKPA